MMDVFSRTERSAVMARVPSKNSVPEMAVRSLLHRLGYRFRLHRADLPGKPDITLPRYRTAIFVNGCFWHQHQGCKDACRPRSNRDYWNKKLDKNVARDIENTRLLTALGWQVLVIWTCEIKNGKQLAATLTKHLKKS